MGLRGEIFSNKVLLPNRTYFFNVKENRMGDLYLNIVESKNKDGGGFDRQSVILFADDLQEFLKGFDESLKVMEKAMREKRQSGAVKAIGAAKSAGGKPRSDEKFERRERRGERPSRGKNSTDSNRGVGRRSERGVERETHYKKRGGDFSNHDAGFKKRGGGGTRQDSGGKNRGREHSEDRGFEHKRGKRVVVKKKFS